MSKIAAIIPARFASTRLPGKPLKIIAGKSLIQIIWEAITKTKLFNEVIIATDDKRISNKVENFGGKIFFSDTPHRSGTDRIAETAKNLQADIFLNIQADEIFITKEPLIKLINAFQNSDISIATLAHPLQNRDDVENPHQVKVVLDKNSNALYFSRSPIPYNRAKENIQFWGHIGVYAFRKQTLEQFASFPQTSLEKTEKLEQLRILENGKKIKVVKTNYSSFGIDTPEDLIRARKLFQG